LDKYFLLYSHYIFWNVMVLLLEYVFSVLFPPLFISTNNHPMQANNLQIP